MSRQAASKAAVDRYLGSKMRGRPGLLYRAASHLIRSGGKRLRPYMAIRSCQMLGGKASDAMPAAAAVEMVHNFTLVHDDIMDNDEVRHGVPAVHKKFGLPVAILSGDVLFSKAYQAIASSKLAPQRRADLSGRLADACVAVCEGQMLDISMASSSRLPTQAQYIEMIRKKTSALFGVSCAMGAVCAGAGAGEAGRLSAFGDNLGVAFQITDDLIGAIGDPKVTKKPVGNDIREGKKSLPILLALREAKGADRRAIRSCFGNSRASRASLQRAVSAIRSAGVQEASRKAALRYAEAARRSISGHSGPAKDDLSGLLDRIVEREK